VSVAATLNVVGKRATLLTHSPSRVGLTRSVTTLMNTRGESAAILRYATLPLRSVLCVSTRDTEAPSTLIAARQIRFRSGPRLHSDP
jgi:hypothetical protein